MEEENNSPTLRPPTINYSIKQRYDSVSEMYNEWWWIRTYKNKPIRGDFDALEKLHKSQWRHHFDSGQV
jgi:hypothetical protein